MKPLINLKNPTPQQVALFSALAIALLTMAVILLDVALIRQGVYWFQIIVIPIFVFGVSYYIFRFFLRKYLYRKIKLIYKTIRKYKLPDEKNAPIDLNEDVFDKVEKDVEEWMVKKSKEVKKEKKLTDYKRRFVGDISHELKTPVFSIQGYLYTLLEGAIYDEKNNIRFLKKAINNVERLQTIIQDLEAISKLESGKMVLDITSFDIKKLAEEVFEELELKAAAKDISLGFKAGGSKSFKVSGDRESIRQVLSNLISNALKYGKDKGFVKVGFYDMHKQVLIEVADDGIGIPQEHVGHVFQRFYRVDKSRSRQQGGSGLGLSIVKHIIETHQQSINVRSTPGVGTTFGFTLERGK